MFVAQRLQRAGGAALAIRASAGPLSGIGSLDSAPDVLLLGAHLAHHSDDVRDRLPHSAVIVLPADAAQDFDGERTLALVRHHLDSGSESATSNTSEETHEH